MLGCLVVLVAARPHGHHGQHSHHSHHSNHGSLPRLSELYNMLGPLEQEVGSLTPAMERGADMPALEHGRGRGRGRAQGNRGRGCHHGGAQYSERQAVSIFGRRYEPTQAVQVETSCAGEVETSRAEEVRLRLLVLIL
jgi:hypothetical protein